MRSFTTNSPNALAPPGATRLALLLDVGIHERSVSTVLAAILAASTRPATEILGHLSGSPLSVKVLASGERLMTDAEQYRLGVFDVASCRWRTSLLVTADGTVAAGVWLLWLPDRLPESARQALDDGTEPAGRILGPLGMRRTDRRALATAGIEEITGAPAAVRSSAVLEIGGHPVAIAEENVTLQFAASLTRAAS
jgi:hypothetical protein